MSINENFQTEKEEEYIIEKDLKSKTHKAKIAYIAKVSKRKVRILFLMKGVKVTTLTVLINNDGKLVVYDYWGWGD